MRLTLKNFRCHQDRTVDIPAKGLVLISGKSGAGKSTILNAILFALYGKLRRPYSHGARTCSVTLEYPRTDTPAGRIGSGNSFGITELVIVRTCRPNRLVVTYKETKYEDDAAQGVIDQVTGMTLEEFRFSSYFDQKKHSSVLSMSPAEQLQFVELIAFVDGDHEEAKTKIRDHVKTLESEQTDLQAQLRLLESQIESREAEFSLIEREIPDDLDVVAVKDEYSSVVHSLKTVTAKLSTKRRAFEKLRDAESDQREIEESQRQLQMEIDHYVSILKGLSELVSEEDIEKMRDVSEKASLLVENLKDAASADQMEVELLELKRLECEALKTKAAELRARLMSRRQLSTATLKVKSYESVRKSSEDAKRVASAIASAKKNALAIISDTRKKVMSFFDVPAKTVKTTSNLIAFLEKTENECIEHAEELENMLVAAECDYSECPKCKVALKWGEEGLEIADEESPSADIDVSETELKLVSTRARLASVTEYLTSVISNTTAASASIPKSVTKNGVMSLKEFSDLSVRISAQEGLRMELVKIETVLKTQKLSKIVMRLQDNIRQKRTGLPKNLDTTLDIATTAKEAKALEAGVEEAWRVRGEHVQFNRQIAARKKTLGSLKKRFLKANKSGPTSANVESEVRELERQIAEYTTALQDVQDKVKMVELYDDCRRTKEEIEKFRATEKKLISRDEIVLTHLQGAYGLESAAREAEFRALEKTIGSINEHAKIYIDQMFEDNISARLVIKRHTKKGEPAARPSIQVQIDYNGYQYDAIDELSGGERQRCDLSFLLAVNDMLGSNMILLDECLNNLDGEMNMEVLNYLQDLCGDKQILVVSHEAVGGVFDTVIHLEK